MKNDFDFIQEKFNSDGIKAPEKLSGENVMRKTENITPKTVKFYNKKAFKFAVSAAACIAIVFACMGTIKIFDNKPVTKNVTATKVYSKNVLKTFESYDEIKKLLKKNNYNLMLKTYEVEDSAESTSTNSQSYGTTYCQVDGVDEADIIKNDGKYIYYRTSNSEIFIYEDEKIISKISDFKFDNEPVVYNDVIDESTEQPEPGEYTSINDMYVKDNRLIVNVSGHKKFDYTKTVVYDLTDIKHPKQTASFTQSGGYSQSRMVGDIIFVVSNYYVYDLKNDDCKMYTFDGNIKTEMPASSIGYMGNTYDNNFIVISAVDTKNGKRCAKSKAVFGCGNTIYCNKNNMYIVTCGKETEILKVKLSENNIEFSAKTNIGNCNVNNQFSMDEYNGFFRIAVTDDKGNNLYVFDKNLKKVGEITGFAKGENIRAVKFMGDVGYVVTFVQTDPLFVIDLSDPKNPKILGEVKLPGFSTNLLTVDENTVLGVGEISREDENGQWINGIKLSLFDVSDKKNPKVLDEYELKGYSSNAQGNHRAIVENKEKNYFIIDKFRYSEEENNFGALCFGVENNKIKIYKNYTVETKNIYEVYSARCTYMGDTIYLINNMGEIYSIKN